MLDSLLKGDIQHAQYKGDVMKPRDKKPLFVLNLENGLVLVT